MLDTLVHALVNQKGVLLYSSRGYRTHKNVLGNIGSSKIVDASMCHPGAAFRIRHPLLQPVMSVNLLGSSDRGCSKIYPTRKGAN